MADLRVTTTRGVDTVLKEAVVTAFKQSLRGPLIAPSDDSYDEARRVWNANINRRPGLIARPVGVADVINAVNFAREHHLLVAVRGGAHSFAGTGICHGGLVIDLSLMKGMRVDPVRHTVRAEGGVKWGEFDRETQASGLATTGGTDPDTGIAGLTLGGGLGWLGYKYGLACDNLLSVDLVTADGQVRMVSDTEHPDLFWGLRGGGATLVWSPRSSTVSIPSARCWRGWCCIPLRRRKRLCKFYRDFSSATHEEVTTYAGLLTSPEGAKMVAIGVCYTGPLAEGARLIAPVRRFGSPLADQIRPMAYTALQSLMDTAYPPRNQYYQKDHFLREISDEAIAIMVEHFARVSSPLSIPFFQQSGGAMRRGHTAYAHRDACYNLVLTAQWRDPGESERHVGWTRELWQALRPYATGGVYVNHIGREDEDGADQVRAAYGTNYQRLAELKQQYDPTNLFHHNQNIKPTG